MNNYLHVVNHEDSSSGTSVNMEMNMMEKCPLSAPLFTTIQKICTVQIRITFPVKDHSMSHNPSKSSAIETVVISFLVLSGTILMLEGECHRKKYTDHNKTLVTVRCLA